MTDLERVVHMAWMTGSHVITSSIVRSGEIVLCKNGKPARFAPDDIEIDFNEKLTRFTVADDDYDLIIINDRDYDRITDEDQ